MRLSLMSIIAAGLACSHALAQDIPGPASALSRAEATAPNRQPAIPRAEQEQAAVEKLAAFEARAGQKPNRGGPDFSTSFPPG